MIKAKLLSSEDLYFKPIDLVKIFGIEAKATDFSNLLGKNKCEEIFYYTSSCDINNVFCIFKDDKKGVELIQLKKNDSHAGIRPVILYDKIDFSKNKLDDNKFNQNFYRVEYGEYPQDSVSIRIEKELEENYKYNILSKTGRTYTINDYRITLHGLETSVYKQLDEYLYNGKRYVRVEANPYSSFGSHFITLSNGKRYESGEYSWIEVKPITWFLDERNKLLFSEKILISGIPFAKKSSLSEDTKIVDYESSMVNSFLNDKFIVEISKRPRIENTVIKDKTIDSIFEEAITRMNEINLKVKVKK